METLDLQPAGAMHHAPGGQHAIDVEDQQSDGPAAFLQRHGFLTRRCGLVGSFAFWFSSRRLNLILVVDGGQDHILQGDAVLLALVDGEVDQVRHQVVAGDVADPILGEAIDQQLNFLEVA